MGAAVRVFLASPATGFADSSFLDAALEKGNLKDTANAHLLLGIAQYNQKQYDTAKRSFQLAMRSEKLADTAQSWMEHVDRELSARAAAASN